MWDLTWWNGELYASTRENGIWRLVPGEEPAPAEPPAPGDTAPLVPLFIGLGGCGALFALLLRRRTAGSRNAQ